MEEKKALKELIREYLEKEKEFEEEFWKKSQQSTIKLISEATSKEDFVSRLLWLKTVIDFSLEKKEKN